LLPNGGYGATAGGNGNGATDFLQRVKEWLTFMVLTLCERVNPIV